MFVLVTIMKNPYTCITAEKLLNPAHPVGRVRLGGIESSHHGAEACPRNHMNGHLGVLKNLKHPEVGKSPGRAPAQGKTYLRFHQRSSANDSY